MKEKTHFNMSPPRVLELAAKEAAHLDEVERRARRVFLEGLNAPWWRRGWLRLTEADLASRMAGNGTVADFLRVTPLLLDLQRTADRRARVRALRDLAFAAREAGDVFVDVNDFFLLTGHQRTQEAQEREAARGAGSPKHRSTRSREGLLGDD